MLTTPPSKIFFLSDQTEAELVQKIGTAKKTDDVFWYRYTKAVTNYGKEFPLSLIQINKLASMKLLTVEL